MALLRLPRRREATEYRALDPPDTWPKIPDVNLPEPWSCNWRRWDTGSFMRNIISLIAERSGVTLCKPLLYRFKHDYHDLYDREHRYESAYWDTASERYNFYFYDMETLALFRFEQNVDSGPGPAESAAYFASTADWSRLTLVGSLTDTPPQPCEFVNPYSVSSGRRPVLLRDLHEGLWGLQPRGSRHALEILAKYPARRDWCHIPEPQLPACWSCEWAYCIWSPYELHSRYNLPAANPIMFALEEHESAVLLESAGVLYLYAGTYDYLERLSDYYKDILGPSPPEHLLFRFDGVYTSISDFFVRADWTKMVLLAPSENGGHLSLFKNIIIYTVTLQPESCTSTDNQVEVSLDSTQLSMTDDGGPLQIPTPKHDLKRTRWDMYRPPGTWGFAPRSIPNLSTDPPTFEWDLDEFGSILPAPWALFDDPDAPRTSSASVSSTGTGTSTRNTARLPTTSPSLKPVMFRFIDYRMPVVAVLSDAARRYYLCDEFDDLWEFEGRYASVEEFVREAGWDMMDSMEVELYWGLDESSGSKSRIKRTKRKTRRRRHDISTKGPSGSR
ncbi:hypothetical protein B0H16DRAFT_1715253 [Mycena metata]|uniref:Uncharacterized protein n=1 Tax=Mycena metata TaxID=1033252 RepID=A0AAD7JRR1_9AGAR|nr:hypothetical protein B0H16DRAFT_1715253 [Mycena metata]